MTILYRKVRRIVHYAFFSNTVTRLRFWSFTLGRTKLASRKIKAGGTVFVRRTPCSVSYAERKHAQEQVDDVLAKEVVRLS